MRFAQLSTGSMRPRPRIYIWTGRRKSSLRTAIPRLPAIVGERLVGLGHAVSIFALADRGAAGLSGLHQFSGQAMRHGLLAAGSGGFDDPAHGERLTPIGA